ncbi:UDP-N-acetylmuramoyl-L-alanine--D-glutamate ligase [Sphingomonas hylomeconis]|uniref:UDP-N-acetylmuramoylalanine--D-glutamate ligase n=1 Tax=Sphingomonas hylomeconis TaxID=1395958 RepID=A0ABV7SY03_9SPHN|nr:UDP-N-acetylmuramoyl-L-alanine--D-glutamate ligase [Sphingomonas hylomeconis]
MITSPLWRGKSYAVLGLARSGAATVRALLASGARVVAWDADAAKRDALLPGTGRGTSEAGGGGVSATPASLAAPPLHHSPEEANGPPPRNGEELQFADPETIDLAGFDALVVSPGVPLNRHPIAAKARAAGVPIIGDIELIAQARASLPAHKVVGVTGTNGKSTTVSLIHHILQTAGVSSRLGGNIGLPILEQEPLPEGGVYVLELSSYQIDLTQSLDCDVGVLLNITPDHLDRYDGFEAYAASKARLFAMQSPKRLAIVDYTAEAELDVLDEAEDPIIQFIADVVTGETADWPALRGPHNLLNAKAAIAATRHLGVPDAVIDAALASFTGLPHRMERVGTIGGVAFVNDSKATNPESTAPALAAFPGIHWILGGQAKSDDLDACAPAFDHVVKAYTIGASGPSFAAILAPHMPVEQSVTLAAAVASAAANAKPGETVLLSPACASFDQFRDFEDRGNQFRALVEALA